MSDAHRIALAAARGAAAAIDASRGHLNDLNVYPVPDGDTGSNLAETARELADGLESVTADGVAPVAAAAKRAVLMGASGNSGAILSQIVGGFADVVGAAPALDSHTLARALRSASDAAYRPVRLPIEGTMLTVIREMAETAEQQAGADLDVAIDEVLAAAARSVVRTQSMLAVLRDAGVVDAGAAGLVEFCRGAVAGARGEHIHAPLEAIDRPLSIEAVHQEESQYRYCTSFLLEGDAIDRDRLERQLVEMGDCLLVVGEAPMCRVHLHTDDPGRGPHARRLDGQHRPRLDRQHAGADAPARAAALGRAEARADGRRPRRRRSPHRGEHGNRARLDRRPAPSRARAPELADGAADRALRRRAVRGLGRPPAGRLLPAAAKRRAASRRPQLPRPAPTSACSRA